MADFYIVSLKHTRREHAYITVWRKDNCGYAWPLSWAGKYSAQQVDENPEYYHNGRSTLAVPCDLLDNLAVPPEKGMVDNDAGPVILNNRTNWRCIIEFHKADPLQRPQPEYKGARRQKEAA